ncbi:MAG: alpha/beta hydrolase [Bacteroidota bacterium]
MLYLLCIFLLLLLVAYAILQYYLPPLPPFANQLIAEVRSAAIPEFIPPRSATVDNRGTTIWYNVLEPEIPPKATVLLVMGHSATAISYPSDIWEPLVQAGYRVIRYDNRGVGLSDWMWHTGKGNRYTLEDMASDAIAILDQENINRAHVWGMSMGGMIAQCLGIHYPERVHSLTLVMTSGYMHDPELVLTDPKWKRQLIALNIRYGFFKDEVSRCKFSIGLSDLLKGEGDYALDYAYIIQRTLYEWRYRRGSNPKVLYQHSAAIAKSGSRLHLLGQLPMPVLVMHGTKDPLVQPMHGEKLMAHLPNARKVWIQGLGHTLPTQHNPNMLKHTLQLFADIEGKAKIS